MRAWAGVVTLGLTAVATAQSGLVLDVEKSRSQAEVDSQIESLAAQMTRNLGQLSRASRAMRRQDQPLAMPVTVTLRREGKLMLPASSRGRGDALVLQFETTGARAFPTAYRQLLQEVYQSAKPVIDAIFGSPDPGGAVRVLNYDDDLGSREIVAGGIYVPNNGQGSQEIRFPVYSDQAGFKAEVAAVNFVHCLLLATLGRAPFPNDAWNEGLVRAAVMRVVRTPGALPAAIDRDLVEGVLEATYDVGATYDWNNQRALGGPRFIAPNLLTAPLPDGGSVGGLYLLRYQMAGSAFQKVLVEQPGFIPALRARWATFTGGTLPSDLALLAELALQDAGGNSLVEGLRFSTWAQRQAILETRMSQGLKLMVQPFAITDGLGGNDYGVFGVQAHAFETKANGDETLLTGTAWPIFWGPEGNRFFTSVQEDRMDVFGGYGSIAPNFLAETFGNQPYRVVVDVPLGDRVARCILPAGTVARPGITVSNFYGTVTGLPNVAGAADRIRVTWTWGSDQIQVFQGAFGKTVVPASFLQPQRLTVEVIRTVNNVETIALRRLVNKGFGPIALDLRVGDESNPLLVAIPKGLSAPGLSLDPFGLTPLDLWGLGSEPLQARWNPTTGRYDTFPQGGAAGLGVGLFVRAPQARTASITGRSVVGSPATVALRPGWNLIANPTRNAVNLSDVRVVVTTDFPVSWAEAVGQSVGRDVFEFRPGANDPASGAPETGSFVSTTSLAPGRAFFVRVFAPEGAVLVFPSTEASRSRDSAREPDWSMRLRIQQGPALTEAFLGQDRAATNEVDRIWDSTNPPGMGGLQVTSNRGLFRDIRSATGPGVWSFRLTGLRPGVGASLILGQGQGIWPRLRVRDLTSGEERIMNAGERWNFSPRTSTRTFEVRLGGPR